MTRNLTVGHPARLITLFALPLVAGNVVQQLYSFVDAFVVGHYAGVDALASVGAVGGLTFLLIGFTLGLTSGLTIPVAQAFGAGDDAQLRRYVVGGGLVAGGVALVLTAAAPASRALLAALNTPPALLDGAAAFAEVSFAGAAATVAFNYLSGVVRALGDSRTPLVFLVVSSLLNAGLVVTFVGYLHLGVRGAALATVAAQALSVAAFVVVVAWRMPLLRLRRADWRLRHDDLAGPARIGFPMGFQMSIIAIGAIILQYAINGLGAEAVAAFTVAQRVDQLAIAPLASLGLALATFVAQNRGARQWHRVRDGVRRTAFLSIGAAVLLGATTILAGPAIVAAFVGADQAEVIDLAVSYFHLNGPLYVLVGLLFVFRNTLQGLGRAAVPTVAGVLELVGRSGAALLLVGPVGFLGVAMAAPLAWVGALVPLWVAWARERRDLLVDERLTADQLLAAA